MNKTTYSDNLKDAVRRWHAKRKKDSNNQINIENTALESENVFNTKKHDIRHISVWNHNNSVESNQLSHSANEQKRLRPTVVENNIKYIFDGPLSFDTIMALKRKKSNIIFGNNGKILNSSSIIEHNDSKCNLIQSCKQQISNLSVIENIKNEIDVIYSKSIDAIQNFSKSSSTSDIINILEYILNYLSFRIQELLSSSNKNIDINIESSEKSLGMCINLILDKSNSTDERFDETALEFLAKYPKIFESLKTLTKIEELNYATPNEINDYILKFNSQIEKIYNLLLNRRI
ncbi:uncharacterized protein cubi_00599 [Cryptosporidium ubiquitum]|uniref:Uncharacterized protein n=1 Tax=Cryptosporidium ubiquitum TaxID=857276 RepID=A0A1J4MC32_9CRYT|nr:uncharacterized protein cubi_00599 [Cryptosporidium ubiquitum]OII71792.1 hypothetical protein cubi_00599 [Cryptosporidium ubiquitum]